MGRGDRKQQGETPRTDGEPASRVASFRGTGGPSHVRGCIEPGTCRHALLLLRGDGPDAVGSLPGLSGTRREGRGPCSPRKLRRLLRKGHLSFRARRFEGSRSPRATCSACNSRCSGDVRRTSSSRCRGLCSLGRSGTVAASPKTRQRSPRTIDGLPDVSRPREARRRASHCQYRVASRRRTSEGTSAGRHVRRRRRGQLGRTRRGQLGRTRRGQLGRTRRRQRRRRSLL
jgi:hypothetical protein